MCFCNNSCNRRYSFPTQRRCNSTIFDRSVICPQCPITPQPPQDLPATNDSIYTVSGAQIVASSSTIPLTISAQTPNSVIGFSNNAITVPAGYYLISYGFTGNSLVAGDNSITLYANNSALANETITEFGGESEDVTASKTILFNATTNTAFSILNTSTNSVNYTNAYITVLKVV